jgi:hypothetical protein
MNVRYPVDAVGQVITAATSEDEELARISPVHDIDVVGETNSTELPSQMWSGPSEPLVCTAAIDTEPIPTTSVAATRAMPVARKDFFFIIVFSLI